MDFKEYSSLIEKFFQGASSPEENRRLREMPEKEMEALFDEYSKDKWEHNDCKIPDETRFRLKSELLSKLHTTEERQQRNTRRAGHAFRYIAIAASICAAAVLGYTAATLTSPVQTFEVTADKGQKSSVTLPDGTAVTNPAEAMAETIRQAPEHPYAKIGAERFATLADEAAALLSEAGVATEGAVITQVGQRQHKGRCRRKQRDTFPEPVHNP